MLVLPDVSFWQDKNETPQQIDFNKMSTQTNSVIIRVGQGGYIDSDFVYNWAKAKEAKLARGSYWFYDSRQAPRAQAELYVKALGNDLGELPLFLDLEERYNGPYAGAQNWQDFLVRLKLLLPSKEIGIYTAYYYFKDTIMPDNLRSWFKDFPLWVANYGVTKPLVPYPWSNWLFWQYTTVGSGALYGAESEGIDLNYFNGTVADFNQRFNLVTTPPVEPPPPAVPPSEPEFISVTSNGTKVNALLEVNYKLNGIQRLQVLDQRVTVPPPPVVTPVTNLYLVDSSKWKANHVGLEVPPNNGPLTQPINVVGKYGKFMFALSKEWIDYIASWNTPQNMEKIVAEDWGPSQGFNDKGMLKMNALVYPGANKVKVISITGDFAKIATIPLTHIPDRTEINPVLTPWLFHIVYGGTKSGGYFNLTGVIVPILGEPRYCTLNALTKI